MFRQRVPWVAQVANNPEVFQYAIGDIEGGRVYSLCFYEGFVVYAMRKPTAAEQAFWDSDSSID